jgi:hypothetical protein
MIICDFCKEKEAKLELVFKRLDSFPGVCMRDLGKRPKDMCGPCRDIIWEMDLREPVSEIAPKINWEELTK